MKPLLIVNVGPAPETQRIKHGDFEHWAARAIDDPEINIRFHDGVRSPLPAYDSLAGVIIMGSLSMVTDREAWMLTLSRQIVELTEQKIPLLGICFGHQLIAQALGGKVGYNPNGLEIGTVSLSRVTGSEDDALFAGVPERFPAQTVHYQSVLALPENTVHLASSAQDPHHAFRVGDCTWGVQFHPEFTAEIMHETLDDLRSDILHGYAEKKQQVTDAAEAREMLVRFARLCRDRCQAG